MIAIRQFIRSGGAELDDTELTAMVRRRMITAPLSQQKPWLREVELILDGYATSAQVAAAVRLRSILKQLEGEIDS